ncbi:MAG TPA: Fur family transcriptional regulator [Methanomassiliicoccales archaeon]|nr:Fur family transcriptional regulator [Methanomassiliicoccales archaeon]
MNSYPTRWTRQMKVVLDLVYDGKSPITADQVYELARMQMPRISLGTVYRNLNRLVTAGLISESKVGTVQCFFPHPYSNTHLECRVCGRLYSVVFDLSLHQVAKETGLTLDGYELRLKGVCKECASRCT